MESRNQGEIDKDCLQEALYRELEFDSAVGITPERHRAPPGTHQTHLRVPLPSHIRITGKNLQREQ